MNRLQDKVAIITGASSGIGKAASELFAKEGATVVMFARRGEILKEIADGINAKGGVAVAFPGSVDNEADVKALFDLTIKKFGRVDILVNNAGFLRNNEGAVNVTDDDCYALFNTNALGTLRTCREALKYMLPAGKGTIVAVVLTGGILGHGGAAYALSKGAEVNLARQIAFDYHLEGIRSNVVCPDGVDTPLIHNENGWVMRDEHTTQSCMNHSCPGTPICSAGDVANVVLFLASDESVGINGQAIICDKGACI